MPSNPDQVADDDEDDPVESRPTFVGEPAATVGFLDAPGVERAELGAAVEDAVAALVAGSVLTVYNDRPGARDAIALVCEHHRLELLATITHPTGGTTFTLRRPG